MEKKIKSIVTMNPNHPRSEGKGAWAVKVRYFDNTEETHYVGTRSEADHLFGIFKRDYDRHRSEQ